MGIATIRSACFTPNYHGRAKNVLDRKQALQNDEQFRFVVSIRHDVQEVHNHIDVISSEMLSQSRAISEVQISLTEILNQLVLLKSGVENINIRLQQEKTEKTNFFIFSKFDRKKIDIPIARIIRRPRPNNSYSNSIYSYHAIAILTALYHFK